VNTRAVMVHFPDLERVGCVDEVFCVFVFS
jgi:hypothetical protein